MIELLFLRWSIAFLFSADLLSSSITMITPSSQWETTNRCINRIILYSIEWNQGANVFNERFVISKKKWFVYLCVCVSTTSRLLLRLNHSFYCSLSFQCYTFECTEWKGLHSTMTTTTTTNDEKKNCLFKSFVDVSLLLNTNGRLTLVHYVHNDHCCVAKKQIRSVI